MTLDAKSKQKGRRKVQAHLVEATPSAGGLAHWVLAAPGISFLGWMWLDLFSLFSPVEPRPVELLIGSAAYVAIIILPFGYGAHRFVTSFPGIFQQAGWTVMPLEKIEPSEQHVVRYIARTKERAATDAKRVLLRVAQGWVYLEIMAILLGAVGMIPLFFSAVEFGFGS